jgi:hypothetical protein
MLTACGTTTQPCANVHPFTPKQHWCDPNYNK